MRTFAIELTANSPLAIRVDHAPSGTKTVRYIPGTSLMGCLASAHRLLFPGNTTDFARFFLHGAIQYPNLYPASFKAKEMLQITPDIYPFPKTALSCKRFPGFLHRKGEKREEERHGMRDSLLEWAMFKLADQNGLPPSRLNELLKAQKECGNDQNERSGEQETDNKCTMPLEQQSGYYRREEQKNPLSTEDEAGQEKPDLLIGQPYVDTRLQVHTGINRKYGVVEDSVLYSREVIEEGMRFWGEIRIPGDDNRLAEDFYTFTEYVYKKDVIVNTEIKAKDRMTHGLVRIGSGRTRGMGKSHLMITERNLETDKEVRFQRFKQRLQSFHQALISDAQAHNLPHDGFFFALTLHSPVILYDEGLRYCGEISAAHLAKLIGEKSQLFKLLYQASGIQRVTGWQELWGTPRTNEYAIESGSVFLFSTTLKPEGDDANESNWLRKLFALEEQGLGKRCAEGYGRICFSDPFHLETRLR